ncbi:hypothetical protein [Pedobacter paludis]|nr:hypothetical protein [Pedobacter paludis]
MMTIRLIAMFLVLLLLGSCNNNVLDLDHSKILKIISSPDKKIDAVLIATTGGATVADGNKVYILLSGKKITEHDHPILVADYTRNLDIIWRANKRLNIKYDDARIFQFTNFWKSEELDNWNYIVEIDLENNSMSKEFKPAEKRPL